MERAKISANPGGSCAEAGEFQSAVKWQTRANELIAEDDKTIGESRLKLYQGKKPSATTADSESRLLDIIPAQEL